MTGAYYNDSEPFCAAWLRNLIAAGLIADGEAEPLRGFWSGADWIWCRDGKYRPVEPGTFPLAHGIPGRVGQLRAYGNAIEPHTAAEFIRAAA